MLPTSNLLSNHKVNSRNQEEFFVFQIVDQDPNASWESKMDFEVR